MKKMFLQQGFRSFLPMFFLLAGMLAFANRAEAQAVGGTVHNWVTPAQAIDNLSSQIVNVHLPAYQAAAPGTPAYESAYNHMIYYKAVVGELQTGAAIPAALEYMLVGIAVGPTGLKAIEGAVTLTKAQRVQLYNDAAAQVSL